jgi:hypothetical protein
VVQQSSGGVVVGVEAVAAADLVSNIGPADQPQVKRGIENVAGLC